MYFYLLHIFLRAAKVSSNQNLGSIKHFFNESILLVTYMVINVCVMCFNLCETVLTAARALQLSLHLHLRPLCVGEESRHASFTEGAGGETSSVDFGFWFLTLFLDRFTTS